MEYFNTGQNEIKKSVVHLVVLIFGFIVIFIFILLTMYYLTPNNYEIIIWDENKFTLQNQIEYIIKPDSTLDIGSINLDKYLRFSSKTNLVIKNSFKSQSVLINEDKELVKSKYNSEILLSNNSDVDKKVIVYFYSLN
jgi:hypothetical protein